MSDIRFLPLSLNSNFSNGKLKLRLNKNLISVLDSSTTLGRLAFESTDKVPCCPGGSLTLPCPTSGNPAVCGTNESWENPYCTLC